MIALMVITNGRAAYLQQTLRSAAEHLQGSIGRRIIVNDCPGFELAHYGFEIVPTGDVGFAGAIQCGWDYITAHAPECSHVFHLEEDFTFNEDIPLDDMATMVDAEPMLAQLALMRQPWNPEEQAAGGIVQLHPEHFDDSGPYTRHTSFFTTNPCIYRRQLTEYGWPQRTHSEGHFSIMLRALGYHFGFWQDNKFEAPKVEHIGATRTGTGY